MVSSIRNWPITIERWPAILLAPLAICELRGLGYGKR